jgi:GAF domain-containing protein
MTNYNEINKIASSLFNKDLYDITIMSNASSLLFNMMEDVSWVGFYLNKDNKLILGPFQGRLACMQIEFGKGVCGTCAASLAPQIVEDVHKFKGHIACDSRSNSEIVLPIIINDKLYGVLDIDSTSLERFSEFDQKGLEEFINIIKEYLK